MTVHSSTPSWRSALVRSLVAAPLALTLGLSAHAQSPTMKVVPFESLQFSPIEAGAPQIAPVLGDPEKGAASIVMKMGRGDFPMHIHTANYQLVVVKGVMKHWGVNSSKAKSKPLHPGSQWYQPAGEVHGDSCLSDQCVWFIHFDGARDFALAKEANPANAHKQGTVVHAVENLKFSKKAAGMPQFVALHGNPDREASSVLMKVGRGPFPWHTHSADYQLMVIKGTARHWGKGQDQEHATPMTPGSYWYQPASEVHADVCESDECLWYVTYNGPRDFALAQ